uniref:Microfibril-associated glycoprotein 4 n=1 Tax=Magallana gigas TaxID=29159 RepID=K1PR98_MAGGI
MTPVVDGLCLLFSFLSISEAMMCQQYRVNLEVDNKVSQQAPSENLHDVSFATCSRSCITGCECFSFNTQSNMCRLYMYSSSCDPSNMTVSEAGWRSYIIYETKPPEALPLDCKSLYMNGKRKSGVYTIYPWERSDPNYRPVQVYCDMETEGGGWTAIQRRVNGEESFYRNWTEYKLGFGSPHVDYWIDDVLLYSGSGRLTGMQFSTFDVDNDKTSVNCADGYYGGWWFNSCRLAYLNGPWLSKSWETLSLDCKSLYMNGKRKSGVYTIYPWERSDPNYRPVQVYCDMETEGGGWTAIQRRVNGEESFYRNWTEYKLGFGSPNVDYWIDDVLLYSGGLRLTGMQFSTFDVDNDKNYGNCADGHYGGWWFSSCHDAYLNGPWLSTSWIYPWYSQYTTGTYVNGTSMLIK